MPLGVARSFILGNPDGHCADAGIHRKRGARSRQDQVWGGPNFTCSIGPCSGNRGMQTLSLTLQNAQVLRPDGVSVGDLSLHAGQIVDTCPGRQIDLSGFHIRPGIIDVHGDGFERHLAPRRGAMKDLSVGLAATEAELAANGITTAVLAQFWSWEGGMRGPDFALRMLQALERYDSQGTDMRVQLRFETHMLEDYAADHSDRRTPWHRLCRVQRPSTP